MITTEAGAPQGAQPDEPATKQETVSRTRKGSPWMWLAVSIILLLACLVTFFAMQSLGKAAEARYTFPLYEEQSQEFLDSPNRSSSNLPEGRLFQIESFAKVGNNQQSRLGLVDLQENPRIVDWKLAEAKSNEGN